MLEIPVTCGSVNYPRGDVILLVCELEGFKVSRRSLMRLHVRTGTGVLSLLFSYAKSLMLLHTPYYHIDPRATGDTKTVGKAFQVSCCIRSIAQGSGVYGVTG